MSDIKSCQEGKTKAALPILGPFDVMKFALSYEGPLPSSGNPRDPSKPPKLSEIWTIRNHICPQIHRLFETHGAFRGANGHSNALIEAVKHPIKVDGKEFYPLARASFKLKCELQIEMLVNHPIATVITNVGDLDNRLKTLFDALRSPQNPQEIKGYMPNIDPYCCLLENDVLISAVQIETLRNIGAPLDAAIDHVRLNIRVRLEPTEWAFVNEPFQHD
jgi:hypothetical protein